MAEQVMGLDHPLLIASGSACVGRVGRIMSDGKVFVDYAANRIGPIHARLATNDQIDEPGQAVLLVFENGDPTLPVIVGLVKDKIAEVTLEPARHSNELVLETKKELTLVCGKSSITLRSDGRIIVKGVEILSRASRTNKIRGASVQIN